MNVATSVGARLRAARKTVRLSQVAVANFVGVSRQAVSQAESEHRTVSVTELVKLCNLYRRPANYFIGTPSEVAPRAPVDFLARTAGVDIRDLANLEEQDAAELKSFAATLVERRRQSAPRQIGDLIKLDPSMPIHAVANAIRIPTNPNRNPPIDVYAAILRIGLFLRFTALEKLSGALLRESASMVPGILVNSDQPDDRVRFSAAHEMGHHVLRHHAKSQCTWTFKGRRFDKIEVEADQFAAEFLTPAEALAELWSNPSNDDLAARVYRTADAFLVSYQAMVVRLIKLGLLRTELSESLLRIRPSDIETDLRLKSRRRKRFIPESLAAVVAEVLPNGWEREASPEWVRQLQEIAHHRYIQVSDLRDRVDDAGSVFEKVALWVARKYPLAAV